MVSERSETRGLMRDALILFSTGLALYGGTMAPTLMWGDGGHLQMRAALGTLHASAGSHPLWVWIAHQFTRIPLGDIAGRVNFVSGLFGAITVALLFLILRDLGLDRVSSALATLALAVSHTFWSYSVRAEVYTLTLALMALQVWLGLRWFRTGRDAHLMGFALALGVGLAAHLMVILYVPAFLWLVWQGRRQLAPRGAAASVGLLAVAVAPLMVLLARDAQRYGMGGEEIVRWALLSFEGYEFGGALLDFSLSLFPSDLFEWLAFLGIQFVGLSVVSGLVGFWKSWQVLERSDAVYLSLLYVGAWLFSFAYRVGDRYVFYLPSYVPFAAWIGLGWQWMLGRLRQRDDTVFQQAWGLALLALLVAIVPVAAYRLAPELVARGITFRDARRVPGPGSKYFFLWPPKAGYEAPRVYAERALEAAPRDSLLLADPIVQAPIEFLQVVEGRRPDVTLRYCCWSIDEALADAGERPVALADVVSDVYPMARLRETYEIRQQGPIYLLER